MRFATFMSTVLVALSLMVAPAFAKPENGARAGLVEAQELLEIMGIGAKGFDKVMTAMSQQLVQVMNQQYPGKDKQVGEIMGNVMKTVLAERKDEKDKMIVKTAAIYAEHFSASELKELTTFYKTDVGRKLSSKLPVIAMETMKTSRAWAQEVAGDIVAKFDAEAKKRGLKK